MRRRETTTFDRRALQGMVAEALSAAVDWDAVLDLQIQLTKSFAVAAGEPTPAKEREAAQLAHDELRHAWKRTTEELHALIDQQMRSAELEECPICAALEAPEAAFGPN